MENKITADLWKDQLKNYSEYLKSKPEKTKMILLTRDFIEDQSIIECTDEYIFWSELYEYFEEFLLKNKDLSKEKIFLLQEFLEFLRGENMSNEKVDREYSKGVASFLNLVKMN